MLLLKYQPMTNNKIQEVVSNIKSLRKRKNNKSDKSYIPGAFSDKVTPDIVYLHDLGTGSM